MDGGFVLNGAVVIESGTLRVREPLGVTTPALDDEDTHENVTTLVAFAGKEERPAIPPAAASSAREPADFHATREEIFAIIR
jgi:hypothetical protein